MGNSHPAINKTDAEELLISVTDLLKSVGVVTWLDCGTLLGAIRDKDFIDYDTDVDIATYYDNFYKARKLTDDPKILETYGIKRIRTSGDKFNRKILSFSLLGTSKTYIDVYFWQWLPKLDTVAFLGSRYNVPHNPKAYLEYLYPNFMVPQKGMHASSQHHKYDIKHTEYYARNVVRSEF